MRREEECCGDSYGGQSLNDILPLDLSKNTVDLSNISGEATMQKIHLDRRRQKTPASRLLTSLTRLALRHALASTAG